MPEVTEAEAMQSLAVQIEVRLHSVVLVGSGWVPGELNAAGGRVAGADGDWTKYLLTQGSSIAKNSCDAEGCTCRMRLSFHDRAEPHWPAVNLRPSMRLRDLSKPDTVTPWRNMGVFSVETPSRMSGQSPAIVCVDCHDIIIRLAASTGRVIRFAEGVELGAAVTALLELAPDIPVDPALLTFSTTALASQREFALDDETTWLGVLTHLLEAGGWRPPWTTRNGVLTSRAFTSADEPVLTLDTSDPRTTVGEGPTARQDLYGVPNRLVFVRDEASPDVSAPTIENGGVITAVNQTGEMRVSGGPHDEVLLSPVTTASRLTSIRSRGGREVGEVVRVDAVDNAALLEIAKRRCLQALQPPLSYSTRVLTSPALWHRDTVRVVDRELGIDGLFLVVDWGMDLEPSSVMDVMLDETGVLS